MHQRIHAYLAAFDWKESEPPPVVDFRLYFEGNTEEECIAPNQWGDGRPSISELYARFKDIAARPDVQAVLVGLHSDWNHKDFLDTFPPAENVHIITSASKAEVERWVDGLHSDGVLKGWTYGRPKNAPEPPNGSTIYSVCWD